MKVISGIKKLVPKRIKKTLIFEWNKYNWQKRQYAKLKASLKDDSIGYVLRKIGMDKKFIELKKLKNKFIGERCFIIATGPSLRIEDVELLKNEYTFGVNSIVNVLDQMSYIPTFYVIQDGIVYERLRDKIKKANFRYSFIGDWKMKPEYFDDKKWIRFPLSVKNYFYTYPEGDYADKVKFSDNAYLRVCDGFSVTYSALQLAVYMGFKEIYLLGTDCNYQKGVKNFADYRTEKQVQSGSSNGEKMIKAYEVAKKWAENSDVKIYNATRGGMLEVFERVNLEDVMAQK